MGANPAFTRVGGATVGDRAGANAHELLHPEDRAALGACWAELVAGARDTAAIEVRLGPAREGRRWFLLSLVVDREAELVYLMGKDVHEQREASNRLGDAEARFRSAFDRSGIGMTITGLDARYLRVNAAFARMVGRSVEELRGMAVGDISHPDDVDPDRSLIVELVANPGGIVEREKRYVLPDGSEILVMLNVSAVAGEDGATQYLIAQMVDITQQRAAERALAESERRFRLVLDELAEGVAVAGATARCAASAPASPTCSAGGRRSSSAAPSSSSSIPTTSPTCAPASTPPSAGASATRSCSGSSRPTARTRRWRPRPAATSRRRP